MSAPSRVGQLQKIFAALKRRPAEHLPQGCVAVELVDEDDISQWFVRFEYQDAASPSTVNVLLKFLLSDPNMRMPLVFVVQPRLVASFIHHGAVCSLELMSQSWALSLEAVRHLLASLHVTLNVSDPNVSVDHSRPNYSSGEHEQGERHIRSVHATLFRPKLATAAPEASRPELKPVPGQVTAEPPVPVVTSHSAPTSHKDSATATPRTVTVASGADLSKTLQQCCGIVRDDSMNAKPLLRVVIDTPCVAVGILRAPEGHHVTFVAGAGAAEVPDRSASDGGAACKRGAPTSRRPGVPRLVVTEGLEIPAGASLSVEGLDIELNTRAGLTVRGALSLVDTHFTGSISVEGRGELRCTRCGLACSRGADASSCFTILDESTVELVSCAVTRHSLSQTPSTCRVLVLASNSAIVRMLDRCTVTPLCCEKTVFAEQHASVFLCDSTVTAGTSTALGVQGCAASCVRTTFIGPCDGVQFQVNDSSRPSGVFAEVGARLTAVECTARSLYFGFLAISSCVTHFVRCHALNVVNGFTVDASTAALEGCTAVTNHVGLFVLKGAKCTARSVSADTAPVSDSKNDPPERLERYTSTAKRLLDSLAASGFVAGDWVDKHRGDAADGESRAIGVPPMLLHAAPCCAFLGGTLGIEVRGASVDAADVLVVGPREACVYGYDASHVRLSTMVFLGRTQIAAAEERKETIGAKLHQSAPGCYVEWCRAYDLFFGFAVIKTPNVTLRNCRATGGTNGYTIDGSTGVKLEACGASTDHVGLFALNQSEVVADNTDVRSGPTAEGWRYSCAVNGRHYGVEVRDATVVCRGVAVTEAADTAFNCYNKGTLDVVDCRAELHKDRNRHSTKETQQQSSGFKAWSGAVISAERCIAKHVVFGYATLGQNGRLAATDCRAEEVTNGFTIDGGQATLTSCETKSNHVGIYVLHDGKCTVADGVFRAKNYGIEVRGSKAVVCGASVEAFCQSGVCLYESAVFHGERLKLTGVSEDPPVGVPRKQSPNDDDLEFPALGVDAKGAKSLTLNGIAIQKTKCGLDVSHCEKFTASKVEIASCDNGVRIASTENVSLQLHSCNVRSAIFYFHSSTVRATGPPNQSVSGRSLGEVSGGSATIADLVLELVDGAAKTNAIAMEFVEANVTLERVLVVYRRAWPPANAMGLVSAGGEVTLRNCFLREGRLQIGASGVLHADHSKLRGLSAEQSSKVHLTACTVGGGSGRRLAPVAVLVVQGNASVTAQSTDLIVDFPQYPITVKESSVLTFVKDNRVVLDLTTNVATQRAAASGTGDTKRARGKSSTTCSAADSVDDPLLPRRSTVLEEHPWIVLHNESRLIMPKETLVFRHDPLVQRSGAAATTPPAAGLSTTTKRETPTVHANPSDTLVAVSMVKAERSSRVTIDGAASQRIIVNLDRSSSQRRSELLTSFVVMMVAVVVVVVGAIAARQRT